MKLLKLISALLFLNTAVLLSQESINDKIAGNPEFSTFNNLVVQAGLNDLLANPNQEYTVFVPNNSAFDSYYTATNSNFEILMNREDLSDFVQYHILNGKIESQNLIVGSHLNTLHSNNLEMTIGQDGSGSTTTDNHTITNQDDIASNGVIHTIAGVLTPAKSRNTFITKWNVTNNITIPINLGYSYSYTVDWGDGYVSTNISSNATHSYQTVGEKTVSIYGNFPAIHFGMEPSEATKVKSINQWGTNNWQSMNNAFKGCEHMLGLANDIPNLSSVTDMSGMFEGATEFNEDINDWNVSNVTDMSFMFYDATNFDQDLDNWDVSNVTNVRYMFGGARAFNGNISNWNTISFNDMSWMFVQANAFNQDINSWNISNVTSLEGTFQQATVFNQDLNNWDVSNVINLGQVFETAEAFNGDVTNWDVSNATNMIFMFMGTNFNQDISGWDVSNVTDISFMFGASPFNHNLGNWDIGSLTTDLQFFFSDSCSRDNYDSTLIGWADDLNGTQTIPQDMYINAQLSFSCRSLAARKKLISLGWTLTEDILDDDVPVLNITNPDEICNYSGNVIDLNDPAITNGSQFLGNNRFFWDPDATVEITNTLLSGARVDQIYVVTTTPSGCTDTASFWVQINALPEKPTLSVPHNVFCTGENRTITATSFITGFGSNGTFDWGSSPGTGGTNPPEDYRTSSSDIGVSKYVVTSISGEGCSSEPSDTLTIETIPPFELGNDTTICGGIIPLGSKDAALPIIWTSSGDGTFYTPGGNTSSKRATYQPSASDIINGSVTISGRYFNCQNTSSNDMTVTINSSRLVDVGDDIIETNNPNINLSATTVNAPSVIWTSNNGEGSFTPNNNKNTVYTPSDQDIEDGVIKLTLTIPASDGCPETSDDLFLTLKNCELTIQETKTENIVELIAVNSNNKVIAGYSWDFGDGSLPATGQAITHIFDSPGTYNVYLTSSTFDSLCTANISHSITIEETPIQSYSIEGTINADDLSLDYGMAYLYYISPNNTFEVKQQINITPSDNGYYRFENLDQGYYYLAAQATPLSSQSTNSLPTYYGDTTNWQGSDPILLNDDLADININLFTFTPETDITWKSGADEIKGNVTFDKNYLKSGSRDIVDNPLPVQNAVILLYDADGSLLSFTTTDEFGEFNFANLSSGIYELRIEYLGTSISISQTIVIDGDNQTIDEFSFKIGQEDLPTGIVFQNKEEPSTPYKVYPNPTAHEVTIELENTINSHVFYTISDSQGNCFATDELKIENNKTTLDVSHLPTGIFYISIDSHIYRIVKY